MRLNSCVIFPLLKRTVRETRQGIPLGIAHKVDKHLSYKSSDDPNCFMIIKS